MPLKRQRGAGSAPIGGVTIRGKISYFGGPNDASTKGAGGVEKSTASGAPTSTPGIAVYNQATLKGYWRVTTPNGHTQIIQQTDIGPAPWTGRIMDFTYSSLHLFGYNEGNFPTNGVATGIYLGKDKQAAIEKGGDAVQAAQAETSGPEVAPGTGGVAKDASLTSDAGSLLSVLQDLLTGNLGDLGGKLAVASLQVVEGVAVGFADLIIAPAWHWNQRATAYYALSIFPNGKSEKEGAVFQFTQFAWTAAFWGVGYALLFTESESNSLKPTPVHRSRLAHHVRKAQALPARKSLVKPKDVKRNTPKKPKPATSKATVTLQNTMSTTRPRQVKVYGTSHTGDGDAATSSVPISTDSKATAQAASERAAESHAHDQPRPGARRTKRRDSPHDAAKGSGARNGT
jgi:hypothetical protein